MKKLKLEELNRLTPDEYKEKEKIPVSIMLDNIRSMHNVGSAFRTSDAFAIEKIYLTGITAKPPHREIHKTALGSTDTVSWNYIEDPGDTLPKLKAEGYTILAIEQTDKSIELTDYKIDPKKKFLLIFGNEVSGVTDSCLEWCDHSIEINQFGTKHSLNVSVSIGILLHEFSNFLRK